MNIIIKKYNYVIHIAAFISSSQFSDMNSVTEKIAMCIILSF